MIIGQTLFKPDASPEPEDAYLSPWFPSGGNELTVMVDVIATINAGTIEVTVQTKNSETDDDNATALPLVWTSGVLSVPGRFPLTAGAGLKQGSGTQGLLELVRFKYTVAGEDNAPGVHFRMTNPSWLSH